MKGKYLPRLPKTSANFSHFSGISKITENFFQLETKLIALAAQIPRQSSTNTSKSFENFLKQNCFHDSESSSKLRINNSRTHFSGPIKVVKKNANTKKTNRKVEEGLRSKSYRESSGDEIEEERNKKLGLRERRP